METNTTIEEVVEALLEELSYGGRKNYLDDTMGMDTAREIIRTTLHQELQKARESERERIKSLFPTLNPNSDSWGTTEMERILKQIDQSELDQPITSE